MPADQISISGPVYISPRKSSGAAYAFVEKNAVYYFFKVKHKYCLTYRRATCGFKELFRVVVVAEAKVCFVF